MVTTKIEDQNRKSAAQSALDKIKVNPKEQKKIPLKIDDKTIIMISPERNKEEAKEHFLKATERKIKTR